MSEKQIPFPKDYTNMTYFELMAGLLCLFGNQFFRRRDIGSYCRRVHADDFREAGQSRKTIRI